MPADKLGEEEQTGRRRRSLLARNRPEADEPEQDDDEELDEDRSVTVGKGRATPSRRRLEEEEENKGNFVTRAAGSVREYFEGVRSELSKVVWPTREETQRLTIIVLVTLIASSAVLGAISLIFTNLFVLGLNDPIILLGLLFVVVVGGLIFYRYQNRRSSY